MVLKLIEFYLQKTDFETYPGLPKVLPVRCHLFVLQVRLARCLLKTQLCLRDQSDLFVLVIPAVHYLPWVLEARLVLMIQPVLAIQLGQCYPGFRGFRYHLEHPVNLVGPVFLVHPVDPVVLQVLMIREFQQVLLVQGLLSALPAPGVLMIRYLQEVLVLH